VNQTVLTKVRLQISAAVIPIEWKTPSNTAAGRYPADFIVEVPIANESFVH